MNCWCGSRPCCGAVRRTGPASCASATWKLTAKSSRPGGPGKRIELTPKEYSLLEYLAANAGRVISRTMIIEHVWDESFQGLTNIVDVYVRHLRSKVDDAASAQTHPHGARGRLLP